jgi:hypothetical protein
MQITLAKMSAQKYLGLWKTARKTNQIHVLEWTDLRRKQYLHRKLSQRLEVSGDKRKCQQRKGPVSTP